MDLLPLTIFPEGGLVSSIITTVWVGVFVLCFFNLRFGWVLSGLVVPGYLVPLLIVKPAAAVVIVIEAVLAYGLIWVFSEKISRGRYPALFGRDRFMGLILASIAVRLIMDGYVLPEFAGWMEENFDRRIDWEDNLQSFGLVIISLLANQFWKPGLARGLFAAIVTIGLTFLIVRYGLMELTNFRISGVSYLYEGLASSILASPKAYIILTLTAMIASHVNVKYGWDFSGILIPALIALQWYQPSKILTSFVEAIAIYCVARLILKLPMMANVTLEGGRKLLLFFNISFAWKMAIGWLIVWQGLDVKTTDFYGFGYLLATLIAIKAHDKNIFPRLARSTLQVSLAGAVFGNIVGFTLSAAVTRVMMPVDAAQDGSEVGRAPQLGTFIVNAIGDAHVRAVTFESRPLAARSREALGELVGAFEGGMPVSAPGFDMAVEGWRVVEVEYDLFAIVRADGAGHEVLVFNPEAERNLAITVPDPTAEPGLGLAAYYLFRDQGARWLVIGAPERAAAVQAAGVVEIFSGSSETAQISVTAANEGDAPNASFANAAASATGLARLREELPGLSVNISMDAPGLEGHRALLRLPPASIMHLASRASRIAPTAAQRPCVMARSGSKKRSDRSLERRAFMRYEVAAPMVSQVRDGKTPFAARGSAALAGFDLSPCQLAGREHWSLQSNVSNEGQIFLASSEEPRKAVLSYKKGDALMPLRVGAALYRTWDADALFIATRADSLLRTPHSSFDVVWQEWVRQQEGVEDPLTFQLRARPSSARNVRRSVDVYLTQDWLGDLPDGYDELESALRTAGLRPERVSDGREFAGFEARPGMSTRYFDGTGGRRYVYGWLTLGGGEES